MSLTMAPSPLPLVPDSPFRPSMPSDVNRLLAAQRLALLGYSRKFSSPPVPANPLSTQSPFEHNPAKSSQNIPKSSQPALSSVARRKLRIANNSVPSYALGNTSNADHMSPATSISNSDSNSSKSTQDLPVLASIGVVDMRFLTRQPPTVQKSETPKLPKSASKESSVGTPTSPSAPLAAGPAPKNQRPKASTRAAPAATTNGKSKASTATSSNKPDDNKDALKYKHAFLFRPESQQPTSGPYVRYSPMYHYYHPYRNMHREAIKAEWSRLHPVVERIPPPEEEEAVTPPRRTSGRQKKTNVRGVAARGRDKSNKKGAAAAAAATSQNNDTPASPLLANGRRSRANAKAKTGGAKTAKGKGGRASAGGAANKRKRADLEEEDKQVGVKEEGVPTPPTKRPRRGAAAAAAIATAALEADDAASNKDEGSPTEALDDGEPKTAVKRRMRPNARKTAAARAAAMEAKVSHTSQSSLGNDSRDLAKQKQKKRSTEDGEATEDEGEGEGEGEGDAEIEGDGIPGSPKDDESVSKPDDSQPAETPGDDFDRTLGDGAGAEKDEGALENEQTGEVEGEQDLEPEPERKSKSSRGKGGFGAARGSRAKTKRGGFGGQKRVSTRGTPRGTPKLVPMDDETSSLAADQEDGAPVGRRNTRKAVPGESALGITVNSTPSGGKSKRAGGGKKQRQDAAETPQGDDVIVDPMLLEEQMSMSQHMNGAPEHDATLVEDERMITPSDHAIAT
ncbi:hypothetical protein M408DRAFT_175812 [Serendipita vermifera MAFF 305830]|uniref:Uncharacterized protein n=1 Tax=Serendipita vermifera MAFF 305830 TaxID=933852 RepID=A0A0C3B666_SERVB|nr:hypothetical protein M408DRAFT_175812 [Serendipita vermifera MAFF 305830]